METRPAHTPAAQDDAAPSLDERRGMPMSMKRRFMLGRTFARLKHLASMHLFKPLEDLVRTDGASPGTCAVLRGQPVYVVSTFTRRGVALADVLPLRRADQDSGATFISSSLRVLSCRVSDLHHAGARQCYFERSKRGSSNLVFRCLPEGEPVAAQPAGTLAVDAVATMAVAARDTCDHHVEAVLARLRPRCVVPAAVELHVDATAAAGRAHSVTLYTAVDYGLRFVVDLLLPQQLDCRLRKKRRIGQPFGQT